MSATIGETEHRLGKYALAAFGLFAVGMILENAGLVSLFFILCVGIGLWYGTAKAKQSDL